MTKGWLLVVLISITSVGCAGLRQFPEGPPNNNYSRALTELDEEYAAAVSAIYGNVSTVTTSPNVITVQFAGPTVSAQDAVKIRNQFIERRMAVTDAYYKEFQAGLVKENVRAEFLIALVGIGVGGAGALVSETASQILSAVSGGLAGGQAAYSKSVLYDKAMTALIAQMQASRKVVKVQIYERWKEDLDKYPLWMARTDLEAYTFAGSLPGAIIATAADAKVKNDEAEARLRVVLRPITQETLSRPVVEAKDKLWQAIDALSDAQAKALIPRVGAQFTEAKDIIASQVITDPKRLLKILVESTVRRSADVTTWQTLMAQ